MSQSVRDGAAVTKDPDAIRVYTFDWDQSLAAGASIDTATFSVSGPDAALTLDAATESARAASVRLTGGTLGQRYRVTCRIVTDETPAQTEDASVDVVIQQQ